MLRPKAGPQGRPAAQLLMCRPDNFEVAYTINPWMDPDGWARDRRQLAVQSRKEWTRLHHALLGLDAQIELVPPVAGAPDLVFTANAAVVLDGTVLLSRFRHAQRRVEEPHFEAAFRSFQHRGVVDAVRTIRDGIVLEGAGDCVWDQARDLFWMGYGPRSDAAASDVVAAEFGVEAISLKLADPRFYHMDTALCPLPSGDVIYFPGAFTARGLAAIRTRVEPEHRIEIAFDDAQKLAANAVCVGNALVISGCGDDLRARLEERGYGVTVTPLHSFLRSGGGAFCLTLRLDRRSAAMGAEITDNAA